MSASLVISEFNSAGYRARTKHNAKSADLTVAWAQDFETAGEKLTKTCAGARYLPVPILLHPKDVLVSVYRELRKHNARTMNIAGNGIYTLANYGWGQDAVNRHLYNCLSLIHKQWPLSKVFTGGQTGVDIAGAVAAHSLGIDVEINMPKNYLQRGVDGVDRQHTFDDIQEYILNASMKFRTA